MSKVAFKSHTWWRLSNGKLVREELVVWSNTEDSHCYQGNKHQQHVEDVHVFTGCRFSVRSTLTSVHRTFSLMSIRFFKRQDTRRVDRETDVSAISWFQTKDRKQSLPQQSETSPKHGRVAVWAKCFKTNASM